MRGADANRIKNNINVTLIMATIKSVVQYSRYSSARSNVHFHIIRSFSRQQMDVFVGREQIKVGALAAEHQRLYGCCSAPRAQAAITLTPCKYLIRGSSRMHKMTLRCAWSQLLATHTTPCSSHVYLPYKSLVCLTAKANDLTDTEISASLISQIADGDR